MAEKIFQEVWWEPKSISIWYITMLSVLWNQVNIISYSQWMISKFIITNKVAKEEFRGSCCSRQNHYMTCKNKHRSTTLLEEILLDLHHHIAKLAWLIQEYLLLVKK